MGARPAHEAFCDTLSHHWPHRAYRNHGRRNRGWYPRRYRAKEELPPHAHCDRKPGPPSAWQRRPVHRGPTPDARSLLNLALGSQFAQLLRTLHSIQRGEFEVIGRSPKPQASGLRHARLIEADADGDILVANGVEVAG